MKIEINNGVLSATPENLEELNAIMQFTSKPSTREISSVGQGKVQCAWCDRAFQSRRRAFTKHVHTMHKRIPLADRKAFIGAIEEPVKQNKGRAEYALRGWETRRRNKKLRELRILASPFSPTPTEATPKVEEDKPTWLS